MGITSLSITAFSITRDSIDVGDITTPTNGGVNPPSNDIFYWPFFTGSLDETIEGVDVTFTNSTDNVPTFDSNGLVLDSANSDSALAPVSTSQVDHGVYTGDLTNPSNYTNGVYIRPGDVAIAMAMGTSVAGKYVGEITPDWFGAILIGSNGSMLQVTSTINNNNFFCSKLKGSDAEIQAGFENTGDSSNLFTVYFHTSAYTLAEVKALRSAVGDGSTWVDTPVNDFYREVEFYINYLDDKFKGVIYRGDSSRTNYEGIGYVEKSGNLSVGYVIRVGTSLDTTSAAFTPAQYDLTKPFIVRTEKRSGVSTTLTVTHNGTTLTDVIGISRDIVQQNYDMLDNVETVGDTLLQTIVSSAVGAL